MPGDFDITRFHGSCIPQELYVTNWEAYKALRDIKTEKAGAPNGSVPQNICSSGKFLLAGRFGQNNMSLEIGKLWVSEVI